MSASRKIARIGEPFVAATDRGRIFSVLLDERNVYLEQRNELYAGLYRAAPKASMASWPGDIRERASQERLPAPG